MAREVRKVRDLRQFARQTNRRLFIGWLLILFLVGDGLIYFVYGREAAFLGVICMLLGLAPIAIIWLGLSLLEWMVNRIDRE